MILKHNITKIAICNYRHLYICLKYRSKALYDDYETQHNENQKLRVPTPIYIQAEKHHHHLSKSSKSSTYSRSYQQCKNYMNIDQNLFLMTKKHNITNSSQKAQQEIKIARIAWTTTFGHIDHELFLMIRKHNIPNIAGWNDRHMSKQANTYHHHLLKQLKKLK